MRPTLSVPASTNVRVTPKTTKFLDGGEWQRWAKRRQIRSLRVRGCVSFFEKTYSSIRLRTLFGKCLRVPFAACHGKEITAINLKRAGQS